MSVQQVLKKYFSGKKKKPKRYQRVLKRYFKGKLYKTDEPEDFLIAHWSFLDLIRDLKTKIQTQQLSRVKRADIKLHLKRVEKEFHCMNKIRRRWRRRKEKGLPIF